MALSWPWTAGHWIVPMAGSSRLPPGLGGGTLGWWEPGGGPSPLPPLTRYPGRLDIGVEHVSDCERLAKQCQLWDLLSDLEAKCEKVSEFGGSGFGAAVTALGTGRAGLAP